MSRNTLLACIAITYILFDKSKETGTIYIIESTQLDIFCPAQPNTYPYAFSLMFNGRNRQYVSCHGPANCDTFDSSTAINASIIGLYLTIKIKDIQQARTIDKFICSYNNEEVIQEVVILAKPVNPACDPPTFTNENNSVSLHCTTKKVYPPASCLFNFRNTTSITFGTINYTHQTFYNDSNIYYESQCIWTSPLSNFEAGSYSFDVFILPNITNDTTYGEKVSPSDTLILTNPGVYASSECFNAPNIVDGYIKPNTTVNCLCILVNEGNPPGSVAWFSDNGQNVGTYLNNTAANLIISPSSDLKQYYCKGQSILKNGSSISLYNVSYAKGPVECKLKTDRTILDLCKTQSITINIICEVEKVSVIPDMNCIFAVNNTIASSIIDSYLLNNIYTAEASTVITIAGDASITCTAVNSIFNDSKCDCKQVIQIREPPILEPHLSIENTGTIIQENIVYRVMCMAPGGIPPVSNVTVSCGNITESTQSGNIFTSPVTFTRKLTGQSCTCTAQHITGCYQNNAAPVFTILNVLYHSTVTNFNVQSTIVENGTLIELVCNADGNPLPTMAIMKGSTILYHTLSSQMIIFSKTMYCTDAGNYICKTNNGLYSTDLEANQMQTLSVYVRCPFQLINPQNSKSNFSHQIGDYFSTNIDIQGYPEPRKLVLFKYDKNSSVEIDLVHTLANLYKSTTEKTTVSYIIKEPPYITVQINISALTSTDFTKYTLVVIQNGFQNLTYTFNIQQAIITSTSEINVGAVVGGIISAVVVILLIVAVIFIKRKYEILMCKKKTDRDKVQNYSELSVTPQQQDRHDYETPQFSAETNFPNRVPETNLQYNNVKGINLTTTTPATYSNTTVANPHMIQERTFVINEEDRDDHTYEKIEVE